MSSFPPGIADHQQPVPPQWQAPPSQPYPAAHYYVPDYGPFGAAPLAQGTVYFGEKWSARNGATIMLIMGGVFTAFGLLLVLAQAFRGGLPFLVFGIIFLLGGIKSRKSDVHTDVICDTYGLTMRRHSRGKGDFPPVHVCWHTVSSTRCVITVLQDHSSQSGATRTTYIQEFAIDVAGSPAIQLSSRSFRQLDALIDLCNRSTQHLGYRWLPKKQARALPVLEESLKFSKVSLAA